MKRAQGERSRGSRPGRGLSLDRIVTATLELVDEQGIGAATMRAVSSRLEVRSMSLYRYVQDRDELFDAVVERIVSELADDPEVQPRPVDGWRPYLAGMAHGVRRYARAHPHAFPLVATRPPAAPWVNPPLRSLRWVEAMLRGLAGEGFSDEQVLFTYRTFNGFLLGYLLLETSAMTLRDPKPGDGSFTATDTVPAMAASPPGRRRRSGSRRPEPGPLRRAAGGGGGCRRPRELIDPADKIDAGRFPTVYRLATGLAEDRWEEEFETGLEHMLDRIAMLVDGGPRRPSGAEVTPVSRGALRRRRCLAVRAAVCPARGPVWPPVPAAALPEVRADLAASASAAGRRHGRAHETTGPLGHTAAEVRPAAAGLCGTVPGVSWARRERPPRKVDIVSFHVSLR